MLVTNATPINLILKNDSHPVMLLTYKDIISRSFVCIKDEHLLLAQLYYWKAVFLFGLVNTVISTSCTSAF